MLRPPMRFGPSGGEAFGASVEVALDHTGDRFAEVYVGSPGWGTGQDGGAGRVFVVSLNGTWNVTQVTIVGNSSTTSRRYDSGDLGD